MSNDEAKAKKERATPAGLSYKSGMNMADGTVDGYTEGVVPGLGIQVQLCTVTSYTRMNKLLYCIFYTLS
jgi:hypothetical protein